MSYDLLTKVHDALEFKNCNPKDIRGDKFKSSCPCGSNHKNGDKNQSLSVSMGTTGIVITCHRGCRFDEIISELGFTAKELFFDSKKSNSDSNQHGHGFDFTQSDYNVMNRLGLRLSKPKQMGKRYSRVERNKFYGIFNSEYVYYLPSTDKIGYSVIRYTGKNGKIIRPWTPAGNDEWYQGAGDQKPILYNWQLLAAAGYDDFVFICEGEKDCDNLAKIGLIGVTNAFGAAKWDASFNEYFQGRHVVILQDNDQAGVERTEKIAPQIYAVAQSLRVVSFPELGKKSDVSDFIDAGNGSADLLERVGRTTPYEPSYNIEVIDDSVPKLAEGVILPVSLAVGVCPWLEQYVNFSRVWSPFSYDGFHIGAGLFILSTIAARRVYTAVESRLFTSLYIILAGESTIWAKSTAATIAYDVIKEAGLTYLLAPMQSTPQAFLSSLSLSLPKNFDSLPQDYQERRIQGLAFSGQKGWYYDEFGQQIAAMARANGFMADWHGILRRLHNCPDEEVYENKHEGVTLIKAPYLSLLGTITPADLKDFAKKGGSFWNDGLFARMLFITPPANALLAEGRSPSQERKIPDSLTRPLEAWHERLGIPTVYYVPQENESGEATGKEIPTVDPIDPVFLPMTGDTYEAYYNYLLELRRIAYEYGNDDLNSSYGRLPEKALKIAILVASLNGEKMVTLRHFAFGQHVIEQAREWTHSLYEAVNNRTTIDERHANDVTTEQKVVAFVMKNGPVSPSQVGAGVRIGRDKLGTIKADEIAKKLVDGGVFEAVKSPRGTKFVIAA